MTESKIVYVGRDRREYLGDGLYAEFDGYQFRLFTQREEGEHEVYLEPDVLQRFNHFVAECQKERSRNENA